MRWRKKGDDVKAVKAPFPSSNFENKKKVKILFFFNNFVNVRHSEGSSRVNWRKWK